MSEAGAIASIPLIVEVDLVDIDIELAVVIAINIQPAELMEIIIQTTARISSKADAGLNIIWDLKVRQLFPRTKSFLIIKD